MGRITIKAYAKVNLALDVLGKRPDGYHEVEMVMQGINLHDLVELEKAGHGIRLSCNVPELEGTDNLAFQAAAFLTEKYRLPPGLSINLHKNIPVQAGLGGGSTDAAAVILSINELYALHLSMDEMREDAARLGSDVPFCLLPLTALAAGRGEKITELSNGPVFWIVLVKPSFGITSKEAYGHLSKTAIKKRPDIQAVIAAINKQQKEKMYEGMANVLEDAACSLYPRLQSCIREIEALGARKVMMSGSGPTLLAFQDNKEEAARLASLLIKPDWQVFVVRTTVQEDIVGRGIIDEGKTKFERVGSV